jgi:hypothetical protein
MDFEGCSVEMIKNDKLTKKSLSTSSNSDRAMIILEGFATRTALSLMSGTDGPASRLGFFSDWSLRNGVGIEAYISPLHSHTPPTHCTERNAYFLRHETNGIESH